MVDRSAGCLQFDPFGRPLNGTAAQLTAVRIHRARQRGEIIATHHKLQT